MYECRVARPAYQKLMLFKLKSIKFKASIKDTYQQLILRNFIEHHKYNDLDVKTWNKHQLSGPW